VDGNKKKVKTNKKGKDTKRKKRDDILRKQKEENKEGNEIEKIFNFNSVSWLLLPCAIL
jgi:hypothetical protein